MSRSPFASSSLSNISAPSYASPYIHLRSARQVLRTRYYTNKTKAPPKLDLIQDAPTRGDRKRRRDEPLCLEATSTPHFDLPRTAPAELLVMTLVADAAARARGRLRDASGPVAARRVYICTPLARWVVIDICRPSDGTDKYQMLSSRRRLGGPGLGTTAQSLDKR